MGLEDRAEAEAAVAALVRVAREMEEEDGQPLDMPWGDFKKLPEDVNGVHWGASSQPLLRQAFGFEAGSSAQACPVAKTTPSATLTPGAPLPPLFRRALRQLG